MSDATGSMTFTLDTGRRPVAESKQMGGRAEHHGDFDPRQLVLRDARPLAGELSLERQGFVLEQLDVPLADWVDDPEAMRRAYYPRVERLVESLTGAREVLVFDHTVRSGDPAEQDTRGRREPVQVVHNDYTEWSAPQRVRDLLPDRAASLVRHRFAVVQTWQPFGQPVLSSPLAICDARSLSAAQLIPAERRHPNRVGEIYNVAFAPQQRWYWFPRMQPDEILVFKTYDSATDGRARFTAHSSFAHTEPPPSAPPRQSVEMRTFAFFDAP